MQSTDLELYKALNNNDGSGNGGRESTTKITSGVMNNIFPSVTSEERDPPNTWAASTAYSTGIIVQPTTPNSFMYECTVAGTSGGTEPTWPTTEGQTVVDGTVTWKCKKGSRFRKVFFHTKEDAQNAKAFIKNPSTAEDHFILMEGTDTDTQGDLTGSEKKHCSGKFASQASAGASQIVINFDNANDVDLEDGDPLWLYGTNGQMFNQVAVSGVSWNGNQATIQLTSQLNVDYPANSICAMLIEIGNINPTFDSWQETSSAGTYDETTYPPELENEGTPRDDWTLTFTSATAFTVTGLYTGSIGSGQISQDFAPINPAFSNPYFTLRSAGWGGTWVQGETITFKTYPSSQGLWLDEKWAAGASSNNNNQVELRLYAE